MDQPPPKWPWKDSTPPKPRPPTQIISSLSSSNPKVEHKPPPTVLDSPSEPTRLAFNSPLPRRSAFIQSQTGSGKTLSYLCPILHDLLPLSTNLYIDRLIGPLAIFIAPTRELAKQISDVLNENNVTRLIRRLVSGQLTGGATSGHEKARLRKGMPILVTTPGPLLDHLQNTSSFGVSNLDLRKLAIQAVKGGEGMEVHGWDWGVRRRTILCTATMREDVQATELDLPGPAPGATEGSAFTQSAQLLQKFIIVPVRLRLVTLIVLLQSLLSRLGSRGSFKVIVFLSCTDSVDFHWRLLGGSNLEDDGDSSEQSEDVTAQTGGEDDNVEVHSPLLPDTSIFRPHGSLPLVTRRSSLRAFSSSPKAPKVGQVVSGLLCTSPLVSAVVQYDLPMESGATEYIHRVGRTARVGRGGQAWTIIAPSEEQWVEWVQTRIARKDAEAVAVEEILRAVYADRARPLPRIFALRAYATHPLDEKHMFHVRHLHLGHLAKSFALREAPSAMMSRRGRRSRSTAAAAKRQARSRLRPRKHGHGGESDGAVAENPDAERRMQVAKSGAIASSGLSEFRVALASGDALERLVSNN
ncbi:P-loop containing nucleoside triphosphate hydrolase protein [Russula compacta]|nr:P-loop containing nucleoside triphosphate hydrolase protein [Russula compacta]